MKLHDALKRLNVLLPERVWEVRSIGGSVYWQVAVGLDTYSGVGDSVAALAVLEQALREEIEMRDWHWSIESGPATPAAWIYTGTDAHAVGGDTPIHALALTLIEALEAEGLQ